ncbi:DUF7344 domain-containing protein [Halorubrum sp. N11]|uniref:DUF7344 domain-containing protein n=1 Tax=Halorubrum sp. N11 TaxID=3402276 RepID=UPI003EB7E9E1
MEHTESDTLDKPGRSAVDNAPKRGESVGEQRRDSDGVLSALADERRRTILRSLDRDDGDASDLDTLVDDIHDEIRDENAPPDTERQEIRIRLHHVDLPKLEAAGLIEYDTDAKRVRGVEDAFARRLRSVVDESEPTNRSG